MTPKPDRSDRVPKPVTAEWLFRAAAHYLERYSSSTENLRRVLERKVMRRCFARAEDPAPHRALVDETVARFVELKLVDDAAFAEAKRASLRRRGASTRQMAAKLGEKGVRRDLVASVLAADEVTDAEAAKAYAKRRRLGPHRLRERAERRDRDRDVAALMRAGFSFKDAAAAIDGEVEA